MYEAHQGEVQHILLLYSGGLDTSAMTLWLQDEFDAKVSTLTVDLGQGEDLGKIQKRAKRYGAHRAIIHDCKANFVENFVKPSIKANGLYMNKYPLATALGRPLMAAEAVGVAHQIGADAIAHGCTGKGNDQVRLESTILKLDPNMKVIAPVRQFNLTREMEMDILKQNGFEVSHNHKKYSVDENLWGISFQGSELGDISSKPAKNIDKYIREYFPDFCSLQEAPDSFDDISITFKGGIPVAIDGVEMELPDLIDTLNQIGAIHGVGIIDYVESYIFGHKGREFYVAPAAKIMILAHKELEHLLLQKQQLFEKQKLDAKWSYMVYHGLWFHNLLDDINKFNDSANKHLNGEVTIRLFKGSAKVVARSSPDATKFFYGEDLCKKGFDENASAGFIELNSLEMRI